MKIYIGVNSDGSEIISKRLLKRFFSSEINKADVFSFDDTQKPPHWIIDYTGQFIPKCGVTSIDEWLTLPSGSLAKMFSIKQLTWDDEPIVIEL